MTDSTINIRLISYLVIDWGTTNFRAFAMSEDNTLLATRELNSGLLNVTNNQFAETLASILEQWIGEYKHLPVYMAGMVGSAKGWHNVSYVSTPAKCKSLNSKAFKFDLPWGAPAVIFPGVSDESRHQQYDVMRGEEVQLFGLASMLSESSFTAVLPGTHSKHAYFSDNSIIQFSSFLTGELFSMVIGHSMLGKGLEIQKPFEQSAFIQGVNEAQNGALTNKLFLAWTHRLFQNLTEHQVPDYISGMLIGYELKELKTKSIYLIGNQALCHRYLLAAKVLSISAKIKSGNECFLAGMSILKQGEEHESN